MKDGGRGGGGGGSDYRKFKRCLERRMKGKLSLNCRRWGGGGAAAVEGVFLCVADRTTGEWEIPEKSGWHGGVGGGVGGGGVYV